MTITVSKANLGVVVGPSSLAVTKLSMGVIAGPPGGLVITKMNFGVVYDPNTPGPGASSRRRQMIVC